jgi:hypothetical protein
MFYRYSCDTMGFKFCIFPRLRVSANIQAITFVQTNQFCNLLQNASCSHISHHNKYCVIKNYQINLRARNLSFLCSLLHFRKCPYTRHSVLDSLGGTAIRKNVLEGMLFILQHEFSSPLSSSGFFNLKLPLMISHTAHSSLDMKCSWPCSSVLRFYPEARFWIDSPNVFIP